MKHLNHVPVARNDESMVIKERCLSRIIKRNGAMLVMIRQDIQIRQRSVHNLPIVHGVHSTLTRRGADEGLALRDDGEFEGS